MCKKSTIPQAELEGWTLHNVQGQPKKLFIRFRHHIIQHILNVRS